MAIAKLAVLKDTATHIGIAFEEKEYFGASVPL